MEKIYATLLINGRRTWDSIPEKDKPKVDALLKQYVSEGVISQEQYNAIKA